MKKIKQVEHVFCLQIHINHQFGVHNLPQTDDRESRCESPLKRIMIINQRKIFHLLDLELDLF